MKRIWSTPAGSYSKLYYDMLQQSHLLIAGAPGSGKSTILHGLVYTALFDSPASTRFVFIDPKRMELCEYKKLPHTLVYASEPDEIVRILNSVLQLIDSRYKEMQKRKEKLYNGSNVYVVIDELADLTTTAQKKIYIPLIQRLCQIGRPARIHVIAVTKCPKSDVIPTPIKVNFDSRVGLRTFSAQDSRNILGVSGCESLPRFGEGYYMKPEGIERYIIPIVSDEEKKTMIDFWVKQRPKIRFF